MQIRALSLTAPIPDEMPTTKKRRPKRLRSRPRDLTTAEVLQWADSHHARTGKWPRKSSGTIPESPSDSWNAVHNALMRNGRGLTVRMTLAQFLSLHRGARNHLDLPSLSEESILRWADRHHRHTKSWPTAKTGPIIGAPGETWRLIDVALRQGCRGLPSGGSLIRLLARHRQVRNRKGLPRLNIKMILKWADLHHDRTGTWPRPSADPIPEAPSETWRAINTALHNGCRGFRGGSSLAQVLEKYRGVRNRKHLPVLTYPKILRWAKAHRARTGEWPREKTGAVVDSPGETWAGINAALRTGIRGLQEGGSSLFLLLSTQRE